MVVYTVWVRGRVVPGWLVGLVLVALGCRGESPPGPSDAGSAADGRAEVADRPVPDTPDLPADLAVDRGATGDVDPDAGATNSDSADAEPDATAGDAETPDASARWRSLAVPSPPRIRALAIDGAGGALHGRRCPEPGAR
jgi:hypothetical protein